jgi:hypothetical protein
MKVIGWIVSNYGNNGRSCRYYWAMYLESWVMEGLKVSCDCIYMEVFIGDAVSHCASLKT